MLTIFTTCRPFDETFSCIQRNALISWTFLDPMPEVFVMGNESGVKEICEELNFINVTDVEYSKQGTPMLDSMMSKAEELASNPYLLLVSSDVILFQSTITALKSIDMPEFCGVTRKKQQREVTELDFSGPWEDVVMKNLRWNLITSGDFFLYPKGYWGKVPPFIIGRTACDSWLFDKSSKKGTLLDLTEAVTIVDYQHSHPTESENWASEKLHNHKLFNGYASIRNANWEMTNDYKIRRKDGRDSEIA